LTNSFIFISPAYYATFSDYGQQTAGPRFLFGIHRNDIPPARTTAAVDIDICLSHHNRSWRIFYKGNL